MLKVYSNEKNWKIEVSLQNEKDQHDQFIS